MKELLEKRASLLKEVQDLAKLEKPTEEQERSFDEKKEAFDNLEAEIKRAEAKEAIRAMKATAVEVDATKEGTTKEEMDSRYEKAFHSYLRNAMTDKDRAVLDSTTYGRANVQSTAVALGGYTIPEGFSGLLEKALLYWMPFNESLVTIWKTKTGNPVPYPMFNDTANKGYAIGEAVNAETSAVAMAFTEIIFGDYKYTSGFLRLNYELLEDSYFDMVSILAGAFGERMGRILTEVFTTGNGTTAPQGVTIGAATGVTSAAAAAITRDDIVGLIHSVDPAYRQNGTLMFNDATLKAIKLLDNGTGDARPLYQISAIAGEAAKIEGFPFVINNEMADIGASAISMVFGDFKKYIVRFIGQDRMKVSTEIFASTDQLGMGLFKRVDAKVLNAGTNPIKKLTHPSS
jgi:HK97 family phage major capsid protein